MKLRDCFQLLPFIIALVSCTSKDEGFTISADQVREGDFQAKALSPTHLVSDYPMELDKGIPQPIIFKLSLNGEDNEGGFGDDHFLMVPPEIKEFNAPTLKFGQRAPRPEWEARGITAATTAHFRVDFRDVLKDFHDQGYTVTPTGDTITQAGFSGLYMAGNTAPLRWIWDNPDGKEQLKFQDTDGDSIYELTLAFDPLSDDSETRHWELQTDVSAFPRFRSPEAPLLEALTNLALEEAQLNIRDDGAFSAGKEWQGIWTRDFAYASHLSLAYLFPENVKKSLEAKLTADNRILQDTGTGGSWPVSVDRHIWTIAAWEYFLVTGDKAWLDKIRDPVINSLKEDMLWNRDPVSGMLQGETSFEDWREQTYPVWMSPSDIHSSHALSSNVLFKRALEIGLALSDDRDIRMTWGDFIGRIDQSLIPHFWSDTLQGPASYVISSPIWEHASHRDLLGESLAILFCNSFSSVSAQLVSSYPRTPIGSPVISHQLPHSPPYHNQAIWPFVESYALLAAKQVHNQEAYQHSFNGLIRSAALYQTNRENYHYLSGRPDQTEINSDRQLWSVARCLGAIYKGLFGLTIGYDFSNDTFELALQPNNPFTWDNFSLKDLELHDSKINIHLSGSGSVIESMEVNGDLWTAGRPLALGGSDYDISIHLKQGDEGAINLADHILPASPRVFWASDTLFWEADEDLCLIELNGVILDSLEHSPVIISDSLSGFFQLVAVDSLGNRSLPTRPQYLGPAANLYLRSTAPYYIELGETTRSIEMAFTLPDKGNYLIRFLYSNGCGTISDGNSCGLANLKINDWWLEQMVAFPHTNSWDQWFKTSWIRAVFKAGENTLILDQDALPLTNMHGELNQFRVQALEIIPVTG
ncbi:MAG: hypothetical protein K9M49_07205 [Candidatus Marinimicrobia bacterium]|nr:hypothetical protein [Candidatus Neomarinimicrobiota bacterium]